MAPFAARVMIRIQDEFMNIINIDEHGAFCPFSSLGVLNAKSGKKGDHIVMTRCAGQDFRRMSTIVRDLHILRMLLAAQSDPANP